MEQQTPILFKNHTAKELEVLLAPFGVKPWLAGKLQSAMVRNGLTSVPEVIEQTSWRVLEKVKNATHIPSLQLIDKQISPRDGFTKYLFKGDGDIPFETVRIPLLHVKGSEKYVVCVSSQVGCAMGCSFCATAKMGFKRNLEPWEMVDQIIQIKKDSVHPVRGVVFMGMGEPMLNYDRVMKAASILCEPCGLAIDAKSITISTVGIVPGIKRFTQEKQPYRLVVSLTSANSEKRKTLLPVENTHPLEELMAAVRDYQKQSGVRIMLAWTMMSGINTSPEDAKELAKLTVGMPVKIDLIDVNDPTGKFKKPSEDELKTFRDALNAEVAQPIVRRYSGGQDINAGCGMLAGLHLVEPDKPSCAGR